MVNNQNVTAMTTKKVFFVVLFLIASEQIEAQTTRIHLFRSAGMTFFETSLKSQALEKPIRIPMRTYIMIETLADSLGFISDGKIGFIRFEKGKNYYFRLRRSEGETVSGIDEMSEQAFKMMLLFNDSALKPAKVYSLGF